MRVLSLLSSTALLLPALTTARPAGFEQTVLSTASSLEDLDLDLGVLSVPRDEPETGTGHLSQWSVQNKEAFLDALRNNSAGDWIIVQGNEGGDLDSLVSALALSYVYTHQPEPQKAVALLQTEEDALDLRPENPLALHYARMSSGHRDLLTLDELPMKPEEVSRRIRGIALVDHNVPRSMWAEAEVVAIIDHHDDRGIANGTANPRIIERSGSCSSLIARYMLDQLPGALTSTDEDNALHGPIPKELIELILRTVAVDTSGLKKKSRQPVDWESAERIFPRSSWRNRDFKTSMKLLDKDMSASRKALDTLDVRSLSQLRRDWKGDAIPTKSSKYPSISLGFASAPVSLEEQIKRTPEGTAPEWFAIERAWTSEIQADVSVALTNFHADDGEKYRQLAVVVAHGYGKRLHEGSANRLFRAIVNAVEESGVEGMVKWKRPDGKKLLPRRAVWQYQSDTASRKFWRPVIEKSVREWKG
ncbi:hypothetical protein DMC30DRAFT_376164 [Rhodotorula diobovata]|uniref:DDH domain-containing protein n=1 Tax=Rhodotorula diobovata TaxID=5288 RepID=A0A5C5FYH0_9BASI|nr:hypothetical protein DMC30DRAFT_376164 [Rhodotorula diobovata]